MTFMLQKSALLSHACQALYTNCSKKNVRNILLLNNCFIRWETEALMHSVPAESVAVSQTPHLE